MASETTTAKLPETPDITISVRQTFGIDSDMHVPAFSNARDHVPDVDDAYRFDHDTTLAILAGFAYNRRVIIQGYHGTGKSTHIEQVAARLNWPCIRINLDSHISRIDLIGKDAIVLRDGKQVTEYREGLLPWALQHPTALVFDEYDAGRPDVMFVIQRVLEVEGKLTLLDQNRVIRPHPSFRLFATANTVGLGDTTGLYHGTQQINQGQMDRWNIVATLNYLPHDEEVRIVLAKAPEWDTEEGRRAISAMVALADLTRSGFINGYSWTAGETLAWGWGTRSGAKATVKAWLNSPEHRAILLSPTYRWVGIGRNCGSYLGHPDACVWTADFVTRW